MRWFRFLTIGLIAAIVITGCGGSAAGGSSESAPTATATDTSDTASSTPNSEATPSTDGAAEGRVVKHAMGETEVPANPERVVVLDTGELDSAIALGVKPVGAVTAFAGGEFPSYLSEHTDGIESVGTIQQPNLEAIAALQPDLILSSKLRHEEIYGQLSEIAPTVFTESVGVTWKENFMLHAQALGKEAEAEQLIAEYQARLDEFKAAMGDDLATTEVSIVRFLPSQVRIYMKKSFIGTVLEDAGLPRPAPQDKDVFMEEGTKERIPDMDGDIMFVTTYGPAEKTAWAEYQSDPLWQQLEVVKNGKVYEVNDDYWMLGIGITAANMVVDDLFKYLAE